MAVKITCIKKGGGNHENPFIAISSLIWVNEETGNTGTNSRLEKYDWIVNDKGVAYVKDSNGNKANLRGLVTDKGTKYVKTYADSMTTDNLLKLPECKN